MEYLLYGGYIVNSDNKKQYINLHIKNGKIYAIYGADGGLDLNIDKVDVHNKLIIPGLVDMHAHFREPGANQKEDLTSGSLAASKGGYTEVFCMPNTTPVLDNQKIIKDINTKCEDKALKIHHYSSITKKLKTDEVVDIENIANLVPGFTNDGVGVQNAGTMYQAMKRCAQINKPIIAHCEDETLLYGGVIHEGQKNKELKLKGILGISESIQIARDAMLALETNCQYHVCHVSAHQSVEAIKYAKEMGVNISAEVCPHHLLLTEDDVVNANFKMNPPLRSHKDKQSLLWAIKNNVIEIIATDHAPHTPQEKELSIKEAPFGIIGIEHAFSLCYTSLVCKGEISLRKLIELMSINPRRIFNLEPGLTIGDSADLTIIDLDQEEIINEDNIVSKSKNTPFIGKKICGLTYKTIVDGKVKYERE